MLLLKFLLAQTLVLVVLTWLLARYYQRLKKYDEHSHHVKKLRHLCNVSANDYWIEERIQKVLSTYKDLVRAEVAFACFSVVAFFSAIATLITAVFVL